MAKSGSKINKSEIKNHDLLSVNEIREIFDILRGLYGEDVGTELEYYNNYQLLVAIMLSAQATDRSVNKVSRILFSKLKTPKDALELGFERINEIVKTINYHNVKSRHIVKMSEQLIAKHNGIVPDTFEELVNLSGVGRKTANLVLSLAFKKNRIAVDTHCFRVANRLGIVKADNVLETEKQLIKNVPESLHRSINNLLIPFGREYCKAINPRCKECPFNKICRQNSFKKLRKK